MAARTRAVVTVSALAICALALTAHIFARWTTASKQGWTGISYEVGGAHLRVESVEPGSPAMRAGIESGAIILAINGSPVHDLGPVDEFRKKDHVGGPILFTIEHDGATRRVTVAPGNPLEWPLTVTRIALNVLAGYLFLAIAAFVFWRGAGDTRARVFLATWGLFGIVRMLLAEPVHAYTPRSPENVALLFTLIALSFFISPTLLHFALIFPRTRPVLERHPAVLRWTYLPPAFSAVLILIAVGTFAVEQAVGWSALAFATQHQMTLLTAATAVAGAAVLLLGCVWFRAVRRERVVAAVLNRPAATLATAFTLPALGLAATQLAALYAGTASEHRMTAANPFLIALALEGGACLLYTWFILPAWTCLELVRSYRDSNREQKQQIRWPLFGIVIALATTALAPLATGAISYAAHIRPGDPAASWLYFARKNLPVLVWLLVPVAFAFSILKYRLMEITVYIRRTVVWALLTGVLAAVFLISVTVLGAVFAGWAGPGGNWPAAASTVAVALVFLPVRQRVQAFVDARFFRRTGDRTAVMKRMTEAIARASTRTELFERAVDIIQEGVGNRWVVALVPSPADGMFIPTASTGLTDDKLRSLRVPRDADEVWPGLGRPHVVRISRAGTVLGIIGCGRKLSDEAYSAADIDFLAATAEHIGLRLDNLRLQQEHGDFERAREIQEALLPRTLPAVPGVQLSAIWQPARTVGGDYYDAFEVAPGRLALAIGDVSGKGMPAALLMSNLQALLRTIAPDYADSPAAVCERINRALCGRLAAGTFVTLFYGVLEVGRKRLVYVNAGHNPPVLCRADGSVLRLADGGLVAGLFPDTTYEEGAVLLEAGDRLLLFTDGVTEAANSAGDDFGDDRLIDLVCAATNGTAAALQASVIDGARQFCAGEFQDDATVLAVVMPQAAAAP